MTEDAGEFPDRLVVVALGLPVRTAIENEHEHEHD
jgi:hypothetical protein